MTRELAEVVERLGLPLHASERVRFEDDRRRSTRGRARRRLLSWVGSVSSGERTLSERAKDDIREGMGREAD